MTLFRKDIEEFRAARLWWCSLRQSTPMARTAPTETPKAWSIGMPTRMAEARFFSVPAAFSCFRIAGTLGGLDGREDMLSVAEIERPLGGKRH